MLLDVGIEDVFDDFFPEIFKIFKCKFFQKIIFGFSKQFECCRCMEVFKRGSIIIEQGFFGMRGNLEVISESSMTNIMTKPTKNYGKNSAWVENIDIFSQVRNQIAGMHD